MAQQRMMRTAVPAGLKQLLNPVSMIANLWSHRELALQMARRDIEGRYKAARLGLLWSVLTPLCLLAIYTFVFTTVFKARWRSDPGEGRGVFALTMFCGMLLYNVFVEVVNRAPFMVVGNLNYVKKVVFPLEIFPVSALLSAAFNMMIGYVVWLIGWVVVGHGWLPWTAIFFPLILLPVWLTTMGIAWVLASLGAFVRDVGHVVVLATQILFFVTPIFYRIDQVPQPYRRILEINPLAHSIEDARRVLMWGELPMWGWWWITLVISGGMALFGYAFFMKSKRAFADVI